MDKCHFKNQFIKIEVFYIEAISNNIDSHNKGVMGLFTADGLSDYRFFTEINVYV